MLKTRATVTDRVVSQNSADALGWCLSENRSAEFSALRATWPDSGPGPFA